MLFQSIYRMAGKRLLDTIVAFVLIVVFSPIALAIVIALFFFERRPIFFCQDRPGLNGKIFRLIKFRTMRDMRDASGKLLQDSERISPLGAFLRRTSLDELPELLNVLVGDMSLVGPRPLLTEYLSRYTPEQNRRHNVRPGVTGLAQVSGRQNIPFSERIAKDVWYADNLSFSADLKILWRTIGAVLSTRDVVVGQEVEEVDDIGLSMSSNCAKQHTEDGT